MDEAQKPAGIQTSKQIMLERMNVAPGEAILEVGCGPGTDLFDLVGRVGPAGRLVGLDASEVMIAEARRRASVLGFPIVFEQGDVRSLPFEDGSFDACRAARLLEHIPNPELALTEMVRVLRHTGRIVVFDFDWDTLVIDHPDRPTTRMIVLSGSAVNFRVFSKNNTWMSVRLTPSRSSFTIRWPSYSSAAT
jgi:ubiquinone/menaquinone biosynthesis C-methylase UbiE